MKRILLVLVLLLGACGTGDGTPAGGADALTGMDQTSLETKELEDHGTGAELAPGETQAEVDAGQLPELGNQVEAWDGADLHAEATWLSDTLDGYSDLIGARDIALDGPVDLDSVEQDLADGADHWALCDPSAPGLCSPAGDAVRCNSTGDGFKLLDDCISGQELCVAGVCLALVCLPGAARCEDGLLWTCLENGTSETSFDCGSAEQFCDQSTRTCRDRICVPGSKVCSEDGDAVKCNPEGSGLELLQACGQLGCLGGACIEGCGDNFCGPDESCASCQADCGCDCGEACVDEGCVFVACEGRQCGDDGCGGTCGACECGETCTGGQCGFTACFDRECGSDGCGGSCGLCDSNLSCIGGKCVCAPQCDGKQCGPDGCGGTCGACPDQAYCTQGLCAECESAKASAGTELGDNGMVWVRIPQGCFFMGCSLGDDDCTAAEIPRHPVQVAAFEILSTEVTEGQFLYEMGSNPSCHWGGAAGDEMPVECVTYWEAASFCSKVGGRLPTSAEWEYAARAGTATAYAFGPSSGGLDGNAWYSKNSTQMKHLVARKAPNAFGLFDMAGNVWEWAGDWLGPYSDALAINPAGPASGAHKVLRGGGFSDVEVTLRVSRIMAAAPGDTNAAVGFRCVR